MDLLGRSVALRDSVDEGDAGTDRTLGETHPMPLKPHEETALDALVAVLDVIEMTYGHDENGDRDLTLEPKDSAADVVAALCQIEDIVSDAIELLDNL
jgi:hypothetical protein